MAVLFLDRINLHLFIFQFISTADTSEVKQNLLSHHDEMSRHLEELRLDQARGLVIEEQLQALMQTVSFFSYSSITAMRGSPTFELFLLLCSLVVLAYTTICLGVLNLILVSGPVQVRTHTKG